MHQEFQNLISLQVKVKNKFLSRLQIRVTKMLQTKIKVFRIGDSRTRYHCFQLLLVPTKIQYPKNHFPETLLNFSLILHLSTPRLAEKLLNKSDSDESSS